MIFWHFRDNSIFANSTTIKLFINYFRYPGFSMYPTVKLIPCRSILKTKTKVVNKNVSQGCI